jgi:hypothetical protein
LLHSELGDPVKFVKVVLRQREDESEWHAALANGRQPALHHPECMRGAPHPIVRVRYSVETNGEEIQVAAQPRSRSLSNMPCDVTVVRRPPACADASASANHGYRVGSPPETRPRYIPLHSHLRVRLGRRRAPTGRWPSGPTGSSSANTASCTAVSDAAESRGTRLLSGHHDSTSL